MRPRDVRSEADILRMRSDNFPRNPEKWGILNDIDKVSLHPPQGGGWIEIPRKEFNAIVDWYMRDQKPLPASSD